MVHPGVILGHPGVILGHPGVILGHPGVILGHPGVVSEPFKDKFQLWDSLTYRLI